MMKGNLTKKQKKEKKAIEKKAEELSNSRPLDVWHTSEYPEVKSVIDHIWSKIKSKGLVKKRGARNFKENVSVIVLDLYVAYQSDPKLYIAYSRNRNDYGKGSKYKDIHIGYTHTITTIDFLKHNKYIEDVAGFYQKEIQSKSKLSRMRATKKLFKLFEKEKVVPGMMKRDEKEPLIILRDKNKKPMEFEYTKDIQQMEENIRTINRTLEKWAILLYVTDDELKRLNKKLKKDSQTGAIDFTDKRLRRIFNNGSFQQGGRFYGGWWQNIPREYRVYIRLDDKDVVECDYSGLHINMLYAMKKSSMPRGDVYHLKGYSNDETFRKFVKRLLLVMINASSRSKARNAIHEEVHYSNTLVLPKEIPSTSKKDLYSLMDAFEKKHEAIKDYFCSGKGIDLQYFDSQMAETVMLHFSPSYAVLPLHDSFVVHHGLERELKKIMGKTFYKMFGSKIKVDLKYNSIEERKKKEPPLLPPEEWTEEYKKSLIIDETYEELLADLIPYSIYYRLLDKHRDLIYSKMPKIPSHDSEFDDILID